MWEEGEWVCLLLDDHLYLLVTTEVVIWFGKKWIHASCRRQLYKKKGKATTVYMCRYLR